MSSICWPEAGSKAARDRSLKRKIYSAAALLAIWSISLLVLLFGLPFIAYQALRRIGK